MTAIVHAPGVALPMARIPGTGIGGPSRASSACPAWRRRCSSPRALPCSRGSTATAQYDAWTWARTASPTADRRRGGSSSPRMCPPVEGRRAVCGAVADPRGRHWQLPLYLGPGNQPGTVTPRGVPVLGRDRGGVRCGIRLVVPLRSMARQTYVRHLPLDLAHRQALRTERDNLSVPRRRVHPVTRRA